MSDLERLKIVSDRIDLIRDALDMEDGDKFIPTIFAMKKRIAALEAENARMKGGIQSRVAEAEQIRTRLAAAEKVVEELGNALEDYGEHGSVCDYTGEARRWVCVCGLDNALAAHRKAEGGESAYYPPFIDGKQVCANCRQPVRTNVEHYTRETGEFSCIDKAEGGAS